ncbi:1,4-alpha-glucan branching protein GlgB [Solitalea longa]|uniref:1,4-alpha-glucan branching protein GlgB n=1 Tax=Solitalea longa TaxID=2079460 RepID=UPI001FAEE2DD|nr:1,4-alpha-glucan branching protein GlgB [Solitalea longa]
MTSSVQSYSRFSDFDISLFKAGKHFRLYEKLGSHVVEHDGVTGTYFAVWAPNATGVSVIGNFNGWNSDAHILNARWDSSGIWEGFIPNIGKGEAYKYFIRTHENGYFERGDPYALFWEEPPRTASIVWDTWYEWNDQEWMNRRNQKNALDKPISVYEVHLASWRRDPSNPDRFLSYQELAHQLVEYVTHMGFTHVEFMPIMEHPFSGSWGYQVTGYFAPTARFGTPQDFMFLVESLHNAGIGIYLDWVPSHFPGDAHGLYNFDGSHLYEHSDPRQGFHPDWNSYIFNYGRNEVRSFLISNAIFWLDRYHADGLRVDAVASMLYLDYSRKEGEWVPNQYGGRENLDAVSFMKELNEVAYGNYGDIQMIAEESTSWPGVSHPTWQGGLGFGMKWMMGWMNDTLRYFSKEPVYRKHHQQDLTFSTVYAFTENFMLPLSHDEVVHGKGSLVSKMPGDEWQRFANLRALFGFMFTHPGTKLLFQGCEFAQTAEWNHDHSLDWHLTQFEPHKGMEDLVKDLNQLYRNEPALFENNFSGYGFEWLDQSDAENSVFLYCRKGHNWQEYVVIAANLTPVARHNYRIGLPHNGVWTEIFNTDKHDYWGSGVVNPYPLEAEMQPQHGKAQSISISLPPLGVTIWKLKDHPSFREHIEKTETGASKEKPAKSNGVKEEKKETATPSENSGKAQDISAENTKTTTQKEKSVKSNGVNAEKTEFTEPKNGNGKSKKASPK